jgi:hypothetical protein
MYFSINCMRQEGKSEHDDIWTEVYNNHNTHLSSSWQRLPKLDKLLVILKRMMIVGANFQAFELYLHNENIISSTFIASNSIHA